MISPSATRMTGEAHISVTRMKRAVDTLESDPDRYRLDLARDPPLTQARGAIEWQWSAAPRFICAIEQRFSTSERASQDAGWQLIAKLNSTA